MITFWHHLNIMQIPAYWLINKNKKETDIKYSGQWNYDTVSTNKWWNILWIKNFSIYFRTLFLSSVFMSAFIDIVTYLINNIYILLNIFRCLSYAMYPWNYFPIRFHMIYFTMSVYFTYCFIKFGLLRNMYSNNVKQTGKFKLLLRWHSLVFFSLFQKSFSWLYPLFISSFTLSSSL